MSSHTGYSWQSEKGLEIRFRAGQDGGWGDEGKQVDVIEPNADKRHAGEEALPQRLPRLASVIPGPGRMTWVLGSGRWPSVSFAQCGVGWFIQESH